MKKIDMSSEAISRRLRQVDQIRYLCLSLMKANTKSDKKKKVDMSPEAITQRMEIQNQLTELTVEPQSALTADESGEEEDDRNEQNTS